MAYIAIATLVVAMVLFISKLIPLEATALSIPVVLAITGTVSPAEAALRGFGNNAVISLGSIFVPTCGTDRDCKFETAIAQRQVARSSIFHTVQHKRNVTSVFLAEQSHPLAAVDRCMPKTRFLLCPSQAKLDWSCCRLRWLSQ